MASEPARPPPAVPTPPACPQLLSYQRQLPLWLLIAYHGCHPGAPPVILTLGRCSRGSACVWPRAGRWAHQGLPGPLHEHRMADRSSDHGSSWFPLRPAKASPGGARRGRGLARRGQGGAGASLAGSLPCGPSFTQRVTITPPCSGLCLQGWTRVCEGDGAPVLVSPGHRLGVSPDKLLSRLYPGSFLGEGGPPGGPVLRVRCAHAEKALGTVRMRDSTQTRAAPAPAASWRCSVPPEGQACCAACSELHPCPEMHFPRGHE